GGARKSRGRASCRPAARRRRSRAEDREDQGVARVTDPFEPEPLPDNHRSPFRLIVPLLVVVGLGALVAWWLQPPPVPPAAHAPATAGKALASRPQPSTAAAASGSPPRSTPKSTQPEAKPEAAPPPAAAEALPKPSLHVTSDVEGAHVFVDRQFVGETPL